MLVPSQMCGFPMFPGGTEFNHQFSAMHRRLSHSVAPSPIRFNKREMGTRKSDIEMKLCIPPGMEMNSAGIPWADLAGAARNSR